MKVNITKEIVVAKEIIAKGNQRKKDV